MGLKQALTNTWLFPRYIGTVYMRPAMTRAKAYARGTMLDIGCGLRQYEPIFAGSVSDYIGIDWPTSADKARSDIVGDALSIPVADNSVDTVLATEVMEHLPISDHFIAEITRVLRIGGRLILSVPFMEPLHEEPRDYYRYTPFSLRMLLQRHGFSIEYIEAKGGWFSVIGYFISHLLYEWANPVDTRGYRPGGSRRLPMLLPILCLCAAAQFTGYMLDRAVTTSRYTLGYIVVATLVCHEPSPEA